MRGRSGVVVLVAGAVLTAAGLAVATATSGRTAGAVVAGLGLVALALGLWPRGPLRDRGRSTAEPGTVLHAEGVIALKATEAASGTTRTARVTAWQLCGTCQGTTWDEGSRCRRCAGYGVDGRTRRAVALRIPAGSHTGTVVRVRGGGTPGVAGVRPPGDLRVRVRVRGRAAVADAPSGAGPSEGGTRPGRASAGERGRPGPGGTVASDHVVVSARPAGFEVRQCRGLDHWDVALSVPWTRVRRLSFDTSPHDKVIALYVWTTGRDRQFACDAAHLTRLQWRTVADHVQRASAGAVTLDLASRDRGHP